MGAGVGVRPDIQRIVLIVFGNGILQIPTLVA